MSRISLTRQSLVVTGLMLVTFLSVVPARAELVNGEDLVDPTAPFLLRADRNVPLLNAFTSFNSYEVSSILIRPNLKIAIVNSQRVRVGERVGNAEIIDIENDRVTISIDGEIRDVMLHQGSVKSVSDTAR